MADSIEAFAVVLEAILKFLNAGHGTTLVLLLVILGMGSVAMRVRKKDVDRFDKEMEECREQHKHCEEAKKQLARGVWHFMEGDHAAAKAIIREQWE